MIASSLTPMRGELRNRSNRRVTGAATRSDWSVGAGSSAGVMTPGASVIDRLEGPNRLLHGLPERGRLIDDPGDPLPPVHRRRRHEQRWHAAEGGRRRPPFEPAQIRTVARV